ncbi:MAG: hypothetical protein D6693_04040 [Planctomycetota bacterium]|nr:MAG: hypothetical protein D6693_04040 [Planctomycetota bacterium]
MNRARTPRSVRLALAILAAAGAGAPASRAATQPAPLDRVLLSDTLAPTRVRLVSISGEAIVYEDERGLRRQATVGGFVGLTPALPDRPAPARRGRGAPDGGVLELTDGQRLPGAPAPTGGEDGAVVWTHPLFGRVGVALDDIARMALRGGPGSPQTPTLDDQLVLVNGDRLVGFVVSLGDPVEFETDGQTVTIPLQRVAEADLANPPAPLAGLVVWLDDGSVLVVTSLETSVDETVRLSLPGGASAEIPLADLRAVVFEAGRLVPLADLTIAEQSPIGERGVFDPVRVLTGSGAAGASDLNAPDVELPGPMRAVFELPAGAARLAAVAELPLEALPWGACDLVIEQDGAELLRERLDQDQPRVEFSLAVAPGPVVIAVEPGPRGPINDRVALRRPVVLID